MPEAFHSRSSSSASNMSGPYSAGTLPRIKPKTDRGLFSDYSSGRSTPPASLGISGLNVNDDTSNIRKSLNFEGRETDDNSGTSDRPRSMIAIGSELTKKFKQGNRPSSANSVSSVGCPDWDELVEDHNGMLSNLATTRGCLLRLQEVV